MRVEEGRTLGDYRLLKQLGLGALGQVFVAEHRFTKKKAALKILPEELLQDRAFLSRFEEEVAQVATLDHPNIAKVYNVSFAEGLYFLATECVVDSRQETKTLWKYLNGRRATQKETFKIAQQIASALDYARNIHGTTVKSFAHRNLKPNSVMVADSQDDLLVKVTDFGLLRVVGCGAVLLRSYKALLEQLALHDPFYTGKVGADKYPSTSPENKQHIELIESLAQNLYFLSPEQRLGDWSESHAADTWAFGVLLYWMLTGSYPEGIWSLEGRLGESALLDWEGVIRSCLQQDPKKRPSSLLPLFTSVSQKSPPVPEIILPPAPKITSIYTRQAQDKTRDKIIKEYSPEKMDPKGIVPIPSDMVLIREGTYYRGSNQGCRDEIPRHQVHIADFFIDVHPVTNEQFVRFLDFLGDEKDHQNHDIIRLKDSRIKRSAGRFSIERGYGKHPVVGVSWYGAVAYAAWLGKRLPTEAEWEVACCGKLENPMYPTGEDIEKTEANYFSSDTTPVMSYPANGYGIYDIAGNVYEWCSDWYEYNFYDYSSQEPDFPKGPIQGVYRVLRGGCWKSLKEDLRCSKRHRNNPGAANGTYGFRCAKDVE